MKISLKSGVSEKSYLTLVFEQKNRSGTSFGVEKLIWAFSRLSNISNHMFYDDKNRNLL